MRIPGGRPGGWSGLELTNTLYKLWQGELIDSWTLCCNCSEFRNLISVTYSLQNNLTCITWDNSSSALCRTQFSFLGRGGARVSDRLKANTKYPKKRNYSKFNPPKNVTTKNSSPLPKKKLALEDSFPCYFKMFHLHLKYRWLLSSYCLNKKLMTPTIVCISSPPPPPSSKKMAKNFEQRTGTMMTQKSDRPQNRVSFNFNFPKMGRACLPKFWVLYDLKFNFFRPSLELILISRDPLRQNHSWSLTNSAFVHASHIALFRVCKHIHHEDTVLPTSLLNIYWQFNCDAPLTKE